jgi:hypothetical protein
MIVDTQDSFYVFDNKRDTTFPEFQQNSKGMSSGFQLHKHI